MGGVAGEMNVDKQPFRLTNSGFDGYLTKAQTLFKTYVLHLPRSSEMKIIGKNVIECVEWLHMDH